MKRSRQESWALDAVVALVEAPGLRVWLAVVGAALAIGTAGYMFLEGWNLSDALYMTVISVTTAGFREVRTLDDGGRVWTMLVTGFGVILIFGSVGLVTEYLVIEATSGRRVGRRMQRQVDELRGHFVLCGYGRVGSTVAHELVHDGERFVVIDANPESLRHARDDGFLVVEATRPTTPRCAPAASCARRASSRRSTPMPRTST